MVWGYPSGMGDTRGVLFDVDGTLLDTNFLHTLCWAEAMRHQGHEVPMAVVHHAIGMASGELLDHCLGTDRDTDDNALKAAHTTLYRQYWGRLVPLPGARDLVRACSERGLDVVLASSASDDELEALTDALDADDAITAATSSADAEAGKPAPDILQSALDASGVDPATSVFVGDSVWDGYAAQRAGIRFVALTCGGTPGPELRRAGAIELWEHPRDLLENLGRSVLGDL